MGAGLYAGASYPRAVANLPLLLIALLAGVAVALQGQAMGVLNRSAGTATAIFATYGSGGLLAGVWWLLRREPGVVVPGAKLGYGLLAGALGLVIVGGIGYAAPRLGLSRTLVITVAAQLGAALLLDYRTIDATKIVGVLVTIAGVWLVVK